MTDTPRPFDRNGIDRRTALKQLGAGAIGTTTAFGSTGAAAADRQGEQSQDEDGTYQNPVGPRHFGDVSVIRAPDGTYYAYGTAMLLAWSDDLVNWQTEYERVLTGDDVGWRDVEDDPADGLWAPNINYYNGQYYLYYSYSAWGSQNNPGIGLATAPDPEGPFEDQGPVFRTEDLPVTNTIDPTMVVVGPNEETRPQGRNPPGQRRGQGSSSGQEGTPYLIWGSYWGIHGVQLTEDATDYVPGTEFHLAGDMKEGPMMIPHGGYWYLIYSTGYCCAGADSSYGVEVGRSKSFFGPYYTREGRDLRNVDEHHAGTSILRGTSRFIGPGHNTAIQDETGQWWMLYHVEAQRESAGAEPNAGRVMMLDPITWDDDGWPVVGCNGVPSTENPVPGSDEPLCPSQDPVADADYLRAVFVAGDVQERLGPDEGSFYQERDRLIQQAVVGRDGLIKTDIEDPGSYSSERLDELPPEVADPFFWNPEERKYDGLQPIKVSNHVSVGFHLDGEIRVSFALYTYPTDDLSADVDTEQVLVDSTTRELEPDHHRLALDFPWADDGGRRGPTR